VSARLEVAVGLVEEATDRFLQFNTYTETLLISDSFLVYPHGVPIDSVVSPSGIGPVYNGYAIASLSGLGIWWDPVFGPVDEWSINPYAVVEYVGGFTYDTLPKGLRLIICDVAAAMSSRQPALTSAAVSSASVSDVSVSYANGGTGTGSVDAVLPGSSRRLTRYRRPTG
jgi:hypothetical protein